MGLNGEPGWVCLMCCNCDSTYPVARSRSCRLLTGAVLFSAIVIQWVTSRDNASTSLHSSIRACNGNGNNGPHARPATAPRDGTSPCRSFSPCLLDAASPLPSTPPAEYPLATTTRCCSHGAAEYDAESCDSMSMTAAKVLAAAAADQRRPAVVVTTTIERETAPVTSLLQSPSSPRPPHKMLGKHHRNSHVDTEVAAATPGEPRRGSKGVAAWAAYGGHPIHGRSSS